MADCESYQKAQNRGKKKLPKLPLKSRPEIHTRGGRCENNNRGAGNAPREEGVCLEGKRQHAHKNVPNKERKTNKDHGAMQKETDNAKPHRPENSLWKQTET